MLRSLTIALLGSGCVFISEDEYAQRLHQSGAGSKDTPCVEASWWTDADGDGYGDPDGLIEACEQPEGTADNGDDCDDTDAERTPDTIWYSDADGDGFGGESTTVTGCDPPAGAVSNSDDCDDENAEVHPDALEDCLTPIDDNCTASGDDPGTNDEDARGCEVWFADMDGDGYAGEESRCLCEPEDPFLNVDSKDCDDDSPEVNPAAAEVCDNGIDDDCDGTASGCGLTGTQSLNDGDVVIAGSVGEARFGTAIAGGDLTGDGVADAVFGGSQWSGSTGRVVLVAGPLTEDRSTADLPAWDGAETGDKLGVALAVLGDTDGDGYDDLIIGAPGADGGATWSGGEAYVLAGPFEPGAELSLLADMTARVQGRAGGAYLGHSVGAAGDFNDDGLADALVSVHGYDDAVLLFGPFEGDIDATDPADVGVRFVGPGGTEAGFAVAGAGDVDGDGLDDVLIGAHYAGSSVEGKVYLIYGHAFPSSVITLSGEADVTLSGVISSDWAGEQLAAGDVDGDGRSDLLISAPGADGGSINAGVVYVVTDPADGSVDLGTESWLTLIGSRAYGRMGTALVHIAGADGVESSHVVAGAPLSDTGTGASAGDIWIFDASAGGTLETTDALGHLTGTVAHGHAGAALSAVGDLDGDGLDDLMVGEPEVDTTVTKGGTVTLFAGGAL